ncbi:MAG: transposase [Pseudomonadota bacterium]
MGVGRRSKAVNAWRYLAARRTEDYSFSDALPRPPRQRPWSERVCPVCGCKGQSDTCSIGRCYVAQKRSLMSCFRWINIVLCNLKTATSRTYHSFAFDKYAFHYLTEAQYRFNRSFDLSTILIRLMYAALTTGRRPDAWMRLSEDER